MRCSLPILTAFAASSYAWLPRDRDIQDKFGKSLFTAEPEDNSTSANVSARWLPGKLPIRGVNLGGWLVGEPWMIGSDWDNIIKCSGSNTQSEFDCVNALGQTQANTNFANHWNTFITESDFDTMVSYTLNTIRIPVGYWIWEALKYPRYA